MGTRRLLTICLTLLILCMVAASCARYDECKPLRDGEPFPQGLPPDIAFVAGRPVWRGLAVGQATREEAITALGPPENTWSSGDLEVWRYYPLDCPRPLYDFSDYIRLFFQQGTLQVVTLDVGDVSYDELRRELGNGQEIDPDKFIEYETRGSVVIFAGRGVTAVINKYIPAYVNKLQYYPPMSLEQYMDSWGRFHPELDMPWESLVPERVDKLGFVPGETRRGEVEAVLGAPDFERVDRRTGATVVYYHAPGREANALHRVDFRDDMLTWMNVKIWEEGYTIGSAMDNLNLGTVGVVTRAPCLIRTADIQYYFWPEEGIVLVARLSTPQRPIEPRAWYEGADDVWPNAADKVEAHVQFEPFSLDLVKCRKIASKIDEEIVNTILFYNPP